MKTDKFKSDLTGDDFSINEKVHASNISNSVFAYISKNNPHFSKDSVLAYSELNKYRQKFIESYLTSEKGELNKLEKTVLKSIRNHELLSTQSIVVDDSEYTFGQKLADKVASFGGSWRFIIYFAIFIAIWMSINVVLLLNKGFDPYPFILLNLILSCLAALQAPVIMMSQNRVEEKDRERAQQDYMINLKSELEIRTLHDKVDHLIIHQQQELLNIQQVQIEMMAEVLERLENQRKR